MGEDSTYPSNHLHTLPSHAFIGVETTGADPILLSLLYAFLLLLRGCLTGLVASAPHVHALGVQAFTHIIRLYILYQDLFV